MGMDFELRPKLVGTRIKRTEDPRLLTGQGCYVDDLQPAGLAHVAFRRSDQAHARIIDIDYSEALKLSGVIGAFCSSDVEGMVRPVFATSKMRDYHATAIRPLARASSNAAS